MNVSRGHGRLFGPFGVRGRAVALSMSVWACGAGAVASGPRSYYDPANDAAFRPTSADGAAMIPPVAPIDLISVMVGNWATSSALSDPYAGSFVEGDADFLRIDTVLAGVVGPPGVLTGAGEPNPFRYGPRPLYAFIDFDIDNEDETGGELTAAAMNRFYANAGRFGGHPGSSDANRFAVDSRALDYEHTTAPYFERSGAEFSLVFCGCSAVTLESELGAAGKLNGVFETGETMIVSGRFFQRAGGFRPASSITGGSTPGAYDPVVRVRFSHDVATDRTTVSLVYPLTQRGAALLRGQSQQPADTNAVNHTSVAEAMQDVISAAQSYSVPGLTYELIHNWREQELEDATDANNWRVRAQVGTAYAGPASSLYLWSDVGFECTWSDVNGDALTNSADQAAISQAIAARDGGAHDADGSLNGSVLIPSHPMGFSLFDVNADGIINATDVAALGNECRADYDRSGLVAPADIFFFLDAWFGGDADFDNSGATTPADIFFFLDAWFTGCA